MDIETGSEIDIFPPSDEQLEGMKKEIRKIEKIEPDWEPLVNREKYPWFSFAYRYHIPVVHVNGVEIARHSLSEDTLDSYLIREGLMPKE